MLCRSQYDLAIASIGDDADLAFPDGYCCQQFQYEAVAGVSTYTSDEYIHGNFYPIGAFASLDADTAPEVVDAQPLDYSGNELGKVNFHADIITDGGLTDA